MKKICVSQDKHMYGNWSGNTDDLAVGREYEVSVAERHSWHTLYSVAGVGGTFNSCLFEDARQDNIEEKPASV